MLLILLVQYAFLIALILHSILKFKKWGKDVKDYELSQMGYASIPFFGIYFLIRGYMRYYERITA